MWYLRVGYLRQVTHVNLDRQWCNLGYVFYSMCIFNALLYASCQGTLEDFSWLCVHANYFRIKCNRFRRRSTLYTLYIPVARFPKCSIFSRRVGVFFIWIEIKLFLPLTSNYCISWWFEKSSLLFNRVELLTSCISCQQYGPLSVIYS